MQRIDDFFNRVKSETRHPINLVASAITIANFAWTLISIQSGGGVPIASVPIGSIAIGFIASCFLEVFLASAFGWAIVYASSKGEGLPYLLAIVTMLVSAWTSLFNIQWLVLGGAPDSGSDVFALVAITALFCGFACYLINDHANRFKIKFASVNEFVKSLNSDGGLFVWQVMAFVVMLGMTVGSSPFAE